MQSHLALIGWGVHPKAVPHQPVLMVWVVHPQFVHSQPRGVGWAPFGPYFAIQPPRHGTCTPGTTLCPPPLAAPPAHPCAVRHQPAPGRTGPGGGRPEVLPGEQGRVWGAMCRSRMHPWKLRGGAGKTPTPFFCPYHGRTLPSSGLLPAAAGQMRTALGGGEGHPALPRPSLNPCPGSAPPHCWFLFLANWRTTLSYSVSPSHSLPCATKGCRSGTARLGTA